MSARLRALVVVTAALAGIAAGPRRAAAQAWVPPARSGALSVSFQTIDHTGHLLTDGTYIDNGRSRTGGLFVDVDYGITRRFSVTFGLPYVFARYTDDDPPPPFLPFLPVDQCRCWHSDWQDLGFTARVNIVDTFDHVLAITASVAAGVPSHAYAYRGEAVVGRQLKEVRFAVDVGRRMDELSRNLSISARLSYAKVEQVLADVTNNRSNASVEAEWRFGGRWSVDAFAAGQRTFGGLRAGSFPGSALVGPGDINTPQRLFEHDRLLRDNYVHVGGGVAYRMSAVELFADLTYFVTGTDTHAGHAITGGITWPFRLGR